MAWRRNDAAGVWDCFPDYATALADAVASAHGSADASLGELAESADLLQVSASAIAGNLSALIAVRLSVAAVVRNVNFSSPSLPCYFCDFLLVKVTLTRRTYPKHTWATNSFAGHCQRGVGGGFKQRRGRKARLGTGAS